MNRSMVFTVVALLGAFVAQAEAQTKSPKISYSYGTSTLSTDVETKNRVLIDAAPLLASGIGIAYERTFDSKFTFGPYAQTMKLTSEKDSSNVASFTTQINTLGLRGRWFVLGDADLSGMYLMAGVAMVNLRTEASYQSTPSGANSTSVAGGGTTGAGYQFTGRDIGLGKMAFNIGATYGTGYEVENTASPDPAGGSTIVGTPSARSGFYLEANVGLFF